MKEMIAMTGSSKYRVYIDNNMNKFHTLFEENKIKISEKIFIFTDDLVYKLHRDIIECIKMETNCRILCIPQGEPKKNINTIEVLYDFLLENGANKNSIIIAFGGGLIGDLAGFAASTYMEGIKLINVPTTLLAQVDSCIAGKVTFNYKGIKNLIGNFYNPIYVYICTGFLKTLNNRQFKDGLGEAIKYGIIKDKELLSFLSSNYKHILERENDKLTHIVKECLRIKLEVVSEDKGLMDILNFGHNIGYGIETTSNFNISHGEAVGLGILTSLKLSENKFSISSDIYNKVESIMSKFGLPVKYKVDNYSSFMYAINHDKKNNEKIRFVLLKDIGKCEVKVEVSEKEIITALKESVSRG
ncbi:3-dehydroquinate synthase [Clostridium sp. P21]|uniref:3-dehydroquinate synthase n=1 Tax=Clostridium muellerianum TaxID=2716538 RepID=A0A7Y0HKZ8_9CLOT|nr:3-dehydroquinate synthase [Clostridium muellerianum]NMM61409.1 3-dehydroquinate synthase [Clostridium muellerianum]